MIKSIKKLLIGILCTINILALSSCKVSKTQIAYTVYPIGYVIERLGNDSVNYISVQNDNDNIQSATLKDDYEQILSDSGVFLHIGNVEPYLDQLKEALNNNDVVDYDLSGLNAIYMFQRYTPLYDGNSIASYVESKYYDSSVFDSIDSVVKDLYIWTNPISMLSMSEDVLNQLKKLYPESSNEFDNNFKSLRNDLVQLDAQFTALSNKIVNNNKEVKFVALSANFGSWQKAYGFQVYPVILSKDGALPDDSQLEVIKERIIKDNVRYIAYEANMSQQQIELFNQLESELNLTRVDLNNCSSLTVSQQDDGKDYLTLMYENLSALEMMASERTSSN